MTDLDESDRFAGVSPLRENPLVTQDEDFSIL